MKKVTTIVSIATLLVACGGSNENVEIAKLKAQKDSLKSIYDGLATQIATIDEQLKALDTTIRLPLVTAEPVIIKSFEHFVDVQGAVEAGGNALLYPETPGKIVAINVKEGARVSKGDVILRLDAGVLQSSLKEVETNYELANSLFQKQERLWKDKIGSEVQFLQAKTNKEGLEQKMKTLKEQLSMYTVRAPFSGVVDEVMPKVGEAANPAMPVARVINYQETYIKADVSEDYISKLNEGTMTKVFFPSLNQEFVTKISRMGDFINPNNRTFRVRIDLGNIGADLKPNLLADIKILDFKADSSIVLPSSIIQQDRLGKEYIYVVDTSEKIAKAKKMILETGLSYQGETIILSGLKGDEKYIDKGARSIQESDQVEIVN